MNTTLESDHIEDRMDALEKEIASISTAKEQLLHEESEEHGQYTHEVNAQILNDRVQFLDEASQRCEKELSKLSQSKKDDYEEAYYGQEDTRHENGNGID